MRYKVDHDLHIHTCLSTCSKEPEMTAQKILELAEEHKLKTICVTDHFWDEEIGDASEWYTPQGYRHISSVLPLPQGENTQFLFGCEAELDKDFRLGLAPQNYDKFDFIIIPTTHMHSRFVLKEEDRQSVERRAALWVERLETVLNMNLPFHKIGLAHLACKFIGFSTWENYEKVMHLISDEDMERLFRKAAMLGVGIELNSTDIALAQQDKELVLRPFRIAKKCGCKFYLGSDAHAPFGMTDAIPLFEQAIDWLELTEEDKFRRK